MSNNATEQYQRSPVTRDRVRPRTIFSVIVFVLATVLTPAAVVGHWAHSTILDAERYIETVGPIGSSPPVLEAFADLVTDAIVDQVDTESLVSEFLDEILPSNPLIDRLAGPLATGIDGLIGQAVDAFVTSDAFTNAWLELNTAAQKGLVAILQNESSGPIQIQGDNVVLNLDSVIDLAQQKLIDEGISVAANISIPPTDKQFVLMTAPALIQAQNFYSFAAPILKWIVVIVAALFILAILLAQRRARMTVAVGIAILGSTLVLHAGVVLGEGIITNQFVGSIFEGATVVIYQNFLSYLIAGLHALLALSVIVIVGGWLAGRTNSANYVRGHFTLGLTQIADRTGWDTGVKLSPYAPIIRWAVVCTWLLVLLGGTLLGTFNGVLFTLLIAGVWTGLEILIRARTTTEEVVPEPVEVPAAPDQA
ncbi:MAG: hypothetical protein OR995_03905 [Candidatus Nanopelagicales bacterium]|nr:hypothetical protein [Candidatus Nanopelagicales bacterium]